MGRGTFPLLVVVVALAGAGFFWGFSVDDAWIVSRVADIGKSTGRFSFNVGIPPTDAVTPLGYAQALALGSWLTGLDSFLVARCLGLGAWLLTWACLAGRGEVSAWTRSQRAFFLLAPCASAPGAAWASAGLETPWVTLFLTLGLLGSDRNPRGWLVCLWLGAAGALRPELLPLVVGVAAGASGGFRDRLRRSGAVAVLPALVGAWRWQTFGHVLPLSVLAKPPDPDHGLRYVLGALCLSGVPYLLLVFFPGKRTRGAPHVGGRPPEPSPRRTFQANPPLLWLVLLLSLLFAGGDWMPLYRLTVPLVPWTAFVAAGALDERAIRGWLGLGLGLLASFVLSLGFRADAVRTVATREHWVERARPWLSRRHHIAAVDVGWVGRATSARIFDLSGVTEPQVARLPGSHTSHAVPPALLDARGVDTWIVRGSCVADSPLGTVRASYLVDARLLPSAEAMGFRLTHVLPIERTDSSYCFLERTAGSGGS